MGSQVGALFGGLWGDAGQNFVDLQGGPDKVFGTKPKVAEFTPTILSDEQKKTAEENLKNADSITQLLDKLMPGFSANLKQGLGTAGELLHGQLPQDVQDEIMRGNAFDSMMGGFGGTQMGSALTARDLGRTSLDLMQVGANSAQQWAKLAETSYDPFMIKTSQQAAATAANNAGTQANEQMKFNMKAAPDPGAAGIFALDTALGMQMLSMGGAMGASAMAGGGGGGASAAGAAAGAYASGRYGSGTTGTAGYGAYQYDPGTQSYVQRGDGFAPVWGG